MTGRTGNTRNLTPWVKGQSGNPNGRPKKHTTIAQLAEDSSERAIRKLAKLIDSDDEKVALAAAQAVLDRAVGKPKQSMDVNPGKKSAADYSESELLTIAGLGGEGANSTEAGENVTH